MRGSIFLHGQGFVYKGDSWFLVTSFVRIAANEVLLWNFPSIT
jgi:hypothetical protein